MPEPIDIAIASIKNQAYVLLKARPLSAAWFELQAKGLGLSMLRGMKAAGVQGDEVLANEYRKNIPVTIADLEAEKAAGEPPP